MSHKEKKKSQAPEATVAEKTKEELAFEKDHEIVKGKFIYHEVPGGEVGFPFKKYRTDKIETYKMKDGEVYSVPRMVAKHLNTNCSYPAWNYKSDDQGRPVMSIAENVRRCSFQSLDFIDEESFPSAL